MIHAERAAWWIGLVVVDSSTTLPTMTQLILSSFSFPCSDLLLLTRHDTSLHFRSDPCKTLGREVYQKTWQNAVIQPWQEEQMFPAYVFLHNARGIHFFSIFFIIFSKSLNFCLRGSVCCDVVRTIFCIPVDG